MEMETKKSKFKAALRTIPLMIICGGIGFFAAKMGIAASSGMTKQSIIILALLFIPLFFIVIAIHEAGHAAAGIWMNFNFKTYIVSPFLWEKNNTGWQFKWNKNINTAADSTIEFEFSAAVQIQEDANKEKYFSYGPLFYAKPIDAFEYKGKSYGPNFDDVFYKPINSMRYRFMQDHQASFSNNQIKIKALNTSTNEPEVLTLVPFGKTILRQVSF